MHIAICDDDPIFTEQLTIYLKEFFSFAQTACPEIISFHSGTSLLKCQVPIDIVFLDIEMPGLNGISVGATLKEKNKNTLIFIVTSYMEYLDDAMRFQVFRYLTKPLEKQRLFRNMKDALYVYSMRFAPIVIETKQGVCTVSSTEIASIESFKKKTIVHTVNKDYVSSLTVAEWLTRLPANCFFQSHRSFIVNFAHISSFDYTMISLCHGQFTAYLTRRKFSLFKASYLQYLESARL